MIGKSGGVLQSIHLKRARVYTWLIGVISLAILVTLLVRLFLQFLTPSQPPRLRLVEDIPLPGARNRALRFWAMYVARESSM